MTARQRGEVDRAQASSGPGLATADDCDDGEEVFRASSGLRERNDGRETKHLERESLRGRERW